MSLLDSAKKGKISPALRKAAKKEGVRPEFLRRGVKAGRIIVPANPRHRKLEPIGIGRGLATKINANFGSSKGNASVKGELRKLRAAVDYGADVVMDLSTGGDIDRVRKAIVRASSVPVGSVPIYQAVVKKKSIHNVTESDLFKAVERHAKDGIDFATIHSGVTRKAVALMKKHGRVTDIVSRGGSLIAAWSHINNKENPFYENYDYLLELSKKYELALSLGDGLRPGSLADATDKAQIEELKVLGKQAKAALKYGVQSMIEGPGHVPLDQIKKNIDLQKKYCNGAPFYVLGPLVTDVAPGYDHITSAIGGALAAAYGADFLCYVTPAEHLALPNVDDVIEGVVASRIAAHAADIAKGLKGARDWDDEMSRARKKRDWNAMFRLALDPKKARKYRKKSVPSEKDVCTMCGPLCSMKVMDEFFL